MIGVRRSLAYSGLQVYLSMALGLASTMILARLLTPAEVGVFSVAGGLLALLGAFRDLGISGYVIREPDLSAAKLGTCYAIAVTAAWSIGTLIALAASPVATFYAAPGLRDVLLVMALGLFLIPLNSIHLALLKRERRFDKLLRIDMASAFAYATTSIGLAFAGASTMALAWGNFAALLATIAMTRRLSSSPIKLVPSFSEWRQVAGFSGNSLGLSLVITATVSLPEIIVGKALGLHEAGVVSRAQGFMRPVRSLVTGAVEPVVYSVATQKHRDGVALTADYLLAASFLSVMVWPVFGFMMMMSAPLMRVLFGPGWDDSATILSWIAINGLGLPIFAFNPMFLTTIGEIRTNLRVQLAIAPFKIGAWLLVFGFDLIVAVQAFVCAHAAHVAVSFAIVRRRLAITWPALAGALLPAVPVTLATLIVPAALVASHWTESGHAWIILTIGGGGSTLMWVLAVFVFNHPVKKELLLALRKLMQVMRRVGLGA